MAGIDGLEERVCLAAPQPTEQYPQVVGTQRSGILAADVKP